MRQTETAPASIKDEMVIEYARQREREPASMRQSETASAFSVQPDGDIIRLHARMLSQSDTVCLCLSVCLCLPTACCLRAGTVSIRACSRRQTETDCLPAAAYSIKTDCLRAPGYSICHDFFL